MEERKKKEINYYDERATEWLSLNDKKWDRDFEGFDPFLLSSYKFLPEYLKDKSNGKRLLDYGAGNGVHSFWLARLGAKVTAIDLSEKLLNIAKMRKEKFYSKCDVEFVKMDAEKLDFEDNCFDIIFDGGTFSSLDLTKALPELARVLKKDGFVIGIETFGHNPITNFKRMLNRLFGKRTGWAASHIFSSREIELSKKYFDNIQIFYFHVISWLAIPLLRVSIFTGLLNFLEILDGALLRVPFLRKYSFKVVFVLKNPKK